MTNASPRLLNPYEIGALVALVDQNECSAAEAQCRSWLTKFPEAGMLWKILSVSLLRQGKNGLLALRRAADLMPLDAEAHKNLASALQDQGQPAEALESFNRCLALEPHDVHTLVQAADCLRELGRTQDSIPLYHRALHFDPRNLEALNNLGNAFLTLQQYADAASHYRMALKIKPDEPLILCNLGRAQRSLGFNEDALASFREAIALNPRQRDVLNLLGVAMREMGYPSDAVSLHARALQSDSNCAESHLNLGLALFDMRRVDDAIEAYQQALSLQPAHAPAQLNMSIAMRQRRNPIAAESRCRMALAIDPHYVDALAFLGELHADRGRFVEAEQLFKEAIRLDPNYAPAFASIATHRKLTLEDEDWARAAGRLLSTALPANNEISLRYALGKYFDDTQCYSNAFEHYARANALRKQQKKGYDGAKLTQHIDEIMRSFNGTSLACSHDLAPEQASPIFIVGMPRSGTSLAEQILASHPAVFGAGEISFWDAAYRRFRQIPRVSTADPKFVAQLASNYLEHLASVAPPGRRVVDKLPANFLYAGFICRVFPHARIIHMQRHPIDTCLSIYFQNFFNIGPYANDLTHLAHYYREYLRITAHWRATLSPANWLEVPYEGLIDDLEGRTRSLLSFVGLPWHDNCLNFDQTDRVVITASKWQVRQKINKSSVGRWRNYAQFVTPLVELADAGGR